MWLLYVNLEHTWLTPIYCTNPLNVTSQASGTSDLFRSPRAYNSPTQAFTCEVCQAKFSQSGSKNMRYTLYQIVFVADVRDVRDIGRQDMVSDITVL